MLLRCRFGCRQCCPAGFFFGIGYRFIDVFSERFEFFKRKYCEVRSLGHFTAFVVA